MNFWIACAPVAKARVEFKAKIQPDKLPDMALEADSWDSITFLNKAKLAGHGAITHSAILLLGRAESTLLLAPAVARISWILKNERNEEKAYEHFAPPFLLNVDKVLARISPDEHRRLKVAKLVEGRYPKLLVAAQVAEVTELVTFVETKTLGKSMDNIFISMIIDSLL